LDRSETISHVTKTFNNLAQVTPTKLPKRYRKLSFARLIRIEKIVIATIQPFLHVQTKVPKSKIRSRVEPLATVSKKAESKKRRLPYGKRVDYPK